MNILTYYQFNDIFFRFVNEKGGYSYLFPKNRYYYFEINEIPPLYYGADALLIPWDRKVDEKMIKIKYGENVSHFENRQIKTKINSSQDILLFDVDHSFGGSEYSTNKSEYIEAKELFDDDTASVSTGIKWLDFFDDARLNDISIDSISATYMKVKYSAEAGAGIVQLEEDIFSLPLKHFISHYQVQTFDDKRFLDYYPLSGFVQKINIFILFDGPVKMINTADFDVSYDSPICSYKIRAAQINDSTMYLCSEYDLKVDHVAAEDYDNLRKMNIAASRARGLNLIYSVKKE